MAKMVTVCSMTQNLEVFCVPSHKHADCFNAYAIYDVKQGKYINNVDITPSNRVQLANQGIITGYAYDADTLNKMGV